MKVKEIVKEIEEDFYISSAVKIGYDLARNAIWDTKDKNCTWLGRRDIIDKEIQAHSIRTAAMSPEFYSGTCGISLFLMELYGETKDELFYKTALGAWLRSVSYLKENDFPASPISFYAGDLGLLYVAYRFIEIEPTVQKYINKEIDYLSLKVAKGLSVNHSLDVIGGNAGAINPLFKLSKNNNLNHFYKIAEETADEIVNLAKWEKSICYWDSPKIHGVELDKPPLTGYSHGSSGIGLGLLEAYRNTGNEKYLIHARGAFEFENSLFNYEENNWVDTRYPHFKREGKITGTFRSAWCHGAPGNVLAHIKASKIDLENKAYHLDMAKRAAQTTHKYLMQKIDDLQKDATLCHGTFGLSDILFTYGTLSNESDYILISKECSKAHMQMYSSINDLPSGINAGGYSPSLMTGAAGIGLHFLRLSSANDIPSVLII